MENSSSTDTSATSAKSNTPEQTKLMVIKDIRAKWSHFSEQEVSALKGKADLVDSGRGQVRPRSGTSPA